MRRLADNLREIDFILPNWFIDYNDSKTIPKRQRIQADVLKIKAWYDALDPAIVNDDAIMWPSFVATRQTWAEWWDGVWERARSQGAWWFGARGQEND